MDGDRVGMRQVEAIVQSYSCSICCSCYRRESARFLGIFTCDWEALGEVDNGWI